MSDEFLIEPRSNRNKARLEKLRVANLKAPLIPVRRWMKKENPTDGIDFAKRLESARMTFR
jgi:hypothetical protein